MKKGISLAVLVVTIIVLVILTAATVATISGENGVIDEAREATSDAKRQNAEDKLYMELSAAQIRAAKEKIDLYTYLTTHATEYAGTVLELQSGSTSTNMKFLVDGYTIVTDGNGAIINGIPLQSITLNETSMSVGWNSMMGNVTRTLTVTYTPDNTTVDKIVTWRSSNTNIATVSNGIVTIKGTGEVTITAECNGKTAECNINIYRISCFVAGTKVLGENGYVNIEDIQVGDKVYTVNEDTNVTELKMVLNKINTVTDEIYTIKIGAEEIEATPRHEFYIVDKGWVRAYDLEVGDLVVTKEGERVTISSIKNIKLNELMPVYNLTVDGNHNYFITDINILVHNAVS